MLGNCDAGKDYIAGGFEKFTVAATTICLTATQLNPISGPFSGQECTKVIFTVETGNMRVTLDGTDLGPGWYFGTRYNPDTETIYTIEGHANLRNFQAVGFSAVVNMHYLFYGKSSNYIARRIHRLQNYIASGVGRPTIGALVISLNPGRLNPIRGPFSGQECEKIVFNVENGDIRITLDGTTPTSSLGTLYIADTEIIYTIEGHANLKRFQTIAATGTAALLRVQYFFRG